MRQARDRYEALRVPHKLSGACLLAAAFALSGATASSAYSATWHVDASAPLGGTGQFWSTAYRYLQDAFLNEDLDSGDQIWVAQGTYQPDQSEYHSDVIINDPNQTFDFDPTLSGVSVYGGFPTGGGAGGGDNFAVRNPEVYITILSGALGVGNSFHVVTAQSILFPTPQPKLNGFLIRYGNATTAPAASNRGGGLRIVQAAPRIVRCTFQLNQAVSGGAVAFETGAGIPAFPLFVNCSFLNNTATADGGAMYVSEKAICHNCLFDSNSAPDTLNFGHGGAIYVSCLANGGSLDLRNCTFSRNSAGQVGGAIDWSSCSTCVQSIIKNCIFAGDSAPAQYGREMDAECQEVTDVTYSDVHQAMPPGQEVWQGEGNINADPLFVDSAAGNFRLSNVCETGEVSPCIDTGSDAPGDVPADLADVDDDGDTTETLPWDRDRAPPFTHWGRKFKTTTVPGGPDVFTKVDMGAYENQHITVYRWDIASNGGAAPPDYKVNVNDWNLLIGDWSGSPCAGCAADFDYNLIVDTVDFLELLTRWCDPCTLCPYPGAPGNTAGPGEGSQDGGAAPGGGGLTLEEALWVMGFSSLEEYGAWLDQASDAEAYASAVQLGLLLGG